MILTLKDLYLQAKDPSRLQLVDCHRTDGKAWKLTTLPGDTQVAGSGIMERSDFYHVIPGTETPYVFGEQSSRWYAHSFRFEKDFQAPNWHPYIVFDFHNTGESKAANVDVGFKRIPGNDAAPGLLCVRRYVGDPMNPTELYSIIGPPQFDEWYDMLYYVKWSSGNDGVFKAWANGRLVMDHKGPNLYQNQGVYLKLANYHLPWPDLPALPTSVIHDRVMIGTTRASVEA